MITKPKTEKFSDEQGYPALALILRITLHDIFYPQITQMILEVFADIL